MKMMLMVCAALLAGVAAFAGTRTVGRTVVQRVYLSQEAVTERLTREITSFREFVSQHQVSSTNVRAIGAWNREHRTVQMTVYGLNTTVNSGPSGAELVLNENGIVIRSGDMAEGAVEFPVNFKDGVYSVAVYDNSRGFYTIAVNAVSLVLSALIFLAMILVYDQYVTRLVKTLSRQVRLVSQGDLERQIRPMSRDEIGQLALDVDAMRLSIIDKLQREEEALQANSQLITAISHDVRTPLTALMGYLEILSDDSLDPQERQAYMEVCKNNAQRLKSLTDELFGFFLVFGKPQPDQVLEDFDAAMLIEQVLLEHEMNLHQKDFRIESRSKGDLQGNIRVDLGHFRRIFDNLFSNILKYADPEKPVYVDKITDGKTICIKITNSIPDHAARVESNRIGLQTCQKLTQAMGGTFTQRKSDGMFCAEVTLPLCQQPQQTE